MNNKILNANMKDYRSASECLKEGGVIVTPSDTNLALTVNPWDEAAIDRAFAIKNRPANAALTLFFLAPEGWGKYGISRNPEQINKLVAAFWPGPLNIILKARDTVPKKMLCGGDTVSMGCLSNPVWRGFMEVYQRPVTMTSANLSGQADGVLVDMEIVLKQVGENVDYILAGTAQGTTTSSTIIDMSGETPTIIRMGDISEVDIEKVIGIKPTIRLAK